MNWNPFGLNRRPFRPLPDASLIVPLAGQDAVLAELREAFEAGDDGAILTGEPGIGKTLVLHRFLDWLPEDINKMMLPTAKYGKSADLHQAIAFDLGQPWQGKTESELRLTVTEHFLGELSQDRRTVLAIDEAHHLHADAIEELRLLSNVAKPGQQAIFVLLCGLPTLRDRLDTPWLAAASQRYRTKSILPLLTDEETQQFLWHQLELSGSRDPEMVLSREAAGLIAESTHGNPRLINHLASTALILAATGDAHTIDVEAVLEAAERLGLTTHSEADELPQSLHPELSDELGHTTLPIPPVAREPLPIRPPKQRQARRQSA